MENISIEGIVIRVIHYNESSEIVHLYTEYGNISVIAKGARKFKSNKLSFCQPLTKVKFIATNSSLPSLIDYSVVDNYNYIKDDLKSNLWFQYLIEIINKLPEKTYYKQIYHMLDKIFSLAKTNNSMLLTMICQTKLLKAFGVEPNFKECMICAKKELDFFSLKNGGFICKDHKGVEVEDAKPFLMLKELYYFDIYNPDFTKLKDIDLKEVFIAITKYYEYHVEIKLHSLSTLIF